MVENKNPKYKKIDSKLLEPTAAVDAHKREKFVPK
jgi:hypothetical protein